MNKPITTLALLIVLGSMQAFAQPSKPTQFLEDPIVADSTRTLMIPVKYNALASSNSKISIWADYYANIIFYNFTAGTQKKLFPEDTYIVSFPTNTRIKGYLQPSEYISASWVFYFVKATDYDRNGKIDGDDPNILYASDKFGNRLTALTPENENAMAITIYENQGFAMVKMQRDADSDFDFQSNDKDYYFMKLDLKTLVLSDKIELPKTPAGN